MTNQFDEDYFLRGVASGKSLYENYRWMPNLTLTMMSRIVDHLGIEMADVVLDYGCARGYIVRALTELGFDAHGVDISEWAIANCDETVKDKVHLIPDRAVIMPCDWIISKDVLEHVPEIDIIGTLLRLAASARKGVFIVIPLSLDCGLPYEVPDYEKDITHQIRWPMEKWIRTIETAFGPGFSFTYQYRLEGCKDNYTQWVKGNGFITVRRLPKITAAD